MATHVGQRDSKPVTEKLKDARQCGARIELHVFELPIEDLWARLRERNESGAEGTGPITRDDLEAAWSVFQPPSAAELAMVDAWWRHPHSG